MDGALRVSALPCTAKRPGLPGRSHVSSRSPPDQKATVSDAAIVVPIL